MAHNAAGTEHVPHARHDPASLFRSTAPYYARYRPGYPAEMFAHFVRRFALDGTHRILDLGCGTGQIAIPIARHAGEVIAVDPEPGMLAEGRRRAGELHAANIDWRRGDSWQLAELGVADLHLVTMGASFHWMDRPDVLRALDRLVLPGGAVVVAASGPPPADEPPAWTQVISEVRARWLGPRRRAGSGTYEHPREGHEEVLRASPFSRTEVLHWTREVRRDLEGVVLAQFSFSYSAPALLGEDADAFQDDLRQALARANPSGVYVERLRTEVIIGSRP
jgi:ubiquinone/menaquinone biosynthesis C-methylase UbiE